MTNRQRRSGNAEQDEGLGLPARHSQSHALPPLTDGWEQALRQGTAHDRATTMHRLQRSAGNGAVQQALSRRSPDHPTTAQRSVATNQSATPVVQRDPPASAGTAKPVTLQDSDTIFLRLPPGGGFMRGSGLNDRALQLNTLLHAGQDEASQVKDILGFLDWTEQSAGSRDLAAVEGAAGMIAEKSRGDKGKDFRGNVNAYTQANPKLAGHVQKLAAAQSGVQAAITGVTRAVNQQNLTAATRDEAVKGAAVKDQKEKVETAKKWANSIFDGVFKLVLDPTAIKDVIGDIAKFAGSELLVGPLIEGAYAFETFKLEEELKAAQQKVKSFQDQEHVLAIQQAVQTLDEKRASYKSELKDLLAATREAENAYATLTESLEKSGKKGQGAAAALNARASAGEQAALGLEKLLKYQSILTRVQSGAKALHIGYINYSGMASSPGGKAYVADDVKRATLARLATTNAATAANIDRWVGFELPEVDKEKSYLLGGTYLEKYTAMDEALHSAVVNR